MKSKLHNLKKAAAFTLVELIIVIAVITILAGIVVVAINPASIFANARNGQRSNDLSTLQAAITKYIAESPATGAGRTLASAVGQYCTTVVSGACTSNISMIGIGNAAGNVGAYTTASGTTPKCDGGSTGLSSALIAANGWQVMAGNTVYTTVVNSTTVRTVDLAALVNAGYLPKVPTDPSGGTTAAPYSTTNIGSNYYMCIDTTIPSGSSASNPGKLVIYAPNVENTTVIPYVVI